MPVFLEPDIVFSIVLDSDKDKPIELRPTFFAKSQSMRGQRRLGRVLDRLTEDKTATLDSLFDDIIDVLSDVLTGWQNMNGIEFSKTAIEEALSYAEAREVLRKVMYNQRIDDDQKKSSE